MSKGMSGSDIARDLGITRQAVSQTLKSGIRKVYNEILRQRIADTPFDAVCTMMVGFGLHESTQDDINDFIYLLPMDIRREVKKDDRCKNF